jgi:hypothetical protein
MNKTSNLMEEANKNSTQTKSVFEKENLMSRDCWLRGLLGILLRKDGVSLALPFGELKKEGLMAEKTYLILFAVQS